MSASFFSDDYDEARQRFLDASTKAGASVQAAVAASPETKEQFLAHWPPKFS